MVAMAAMPAMLEAHECYRAAMSLNNTGVALIERGYYGAARDVLGDAISITSHLHHDQTVIGSTGPRPLDVKSCLRRAFQQMALMKPLGINTSLELRPDVLRVHTISDDKGPATLEAALYSGITIRHAFILRIEPVDYDSPLDRIVSTDFSVIIHNFAVAYRFLAENQGSKDAASDYLSMALRMCHIAYSTLADHANSGTEDESQLLSVLPLSILTIQSTIQISIELGLENEASDNMWTLCRLRDVARHFEEIELGRAFQVAAAA